MSVTSCLIFSDDMGYNLKMSPIGEISTALTLPVGDNYPKLKFVNSFH